MGAPSAKAINIGIGLIAAIVIWNLASNRVEPSPTPTASPGVSQDVDPLPYVPWDDYASTVRTRIDEMAVSADCSGLQVEFDSADDADAATRNRTGHGNADLMSYIDAQMRRAGCY